MCVLRAVALRSTSRQMRACVCVCVCVCAVLCVGAYVGQMGKTASALESQAQRSIVAAVCAQHGTVAKMPYLAKCVAMRRKSAPKLHQEMEQRTLQSMCASVMSRGKTFEGTLWRFLAMQ